MSVFTDQIGWPVFLPQTPKRIVSLVPSQTELLYHLGLETEVYGITKFCVHPQQWFKNKTKIGGTKNINIENIKSLHPDLIIANKEENVKEQIEILAKDFPVWVSDVTNLNEALQMIFSIGKLTGKEAEAQILSDGIRNNFAQLPSVNHPLQTCYLIWREPYMTVGGDTFINDMLQRAGFKNIFVNGSRYPEVNMAELQALNCELLLLSSEPYPFTEKHITELQHYLPRTQILLADGEMFSWYGSRMQYAPAYFRNLRQQIHPLSLL